MMCFRLLATDMLERTHRLEQRAPAELGHCRRHRDTDTGRQQGAAVSPERDSGRRWLQLSWQLVGEVVWAVRLTKHGLAFHH